MHFHTLLHKIRRFKQSTANCFKILNHQFNLLQNRFTSTYDRSMLRQIICKFKNLLIALPKRNRQQVILKTNQVFLTLVVITPVIIISIVPNQNY